MASVKLGTLIIRTLAKPIATQVKERARQHPRFRELCMSLAQFVYRTEIKLRTNILGEAVRPTHVRPLSETRAIDQGANFIAEGFMFSVAAALIIGETWRSSRNQSKRRDSVDDQLEDLVTSFNELKTRVDTLVQNWEGQLGEEKQRNDELTRILDRIVGIGLRAGWSELQETPLRVPHVQVSGSLSSNPPPHVISLEEELSISNMSPDDTKIDVAKPEQSDSGKEV